MKASTLSGLLLALLFAPFGSLQTQDSGNPVRFMTYNIRFAGTVESDSIYAWENRKEHVANIIRFNKADLIGLQEALKLQIDDLKIMLPGFEFLGKGRDDGNTGGEYSAILYRTARFTVLKDSTFWLSETPSKVSRGWDAACNRVVTWAQYKDNITQKVFFFFNTHFDHIGEKARQNSAVLLLEKIKEIAGEYPVVVTGDFNFMQNTEYYKILTDAAAANGLEILKDAQTESQHPHYGQNVTWNNFGKNTRDDIKIDYIFIKNQVKVITHGIISEKFEGRFPSDHMPVVSDIIL